MAGKIMNSQHHSSENGSKWTTNGDSPVHGALASDSERDSLVTASRNRCAKEAMEVDVGVTGLPGDLTTPPLTPRESANSH